MAAIWDHRRIGSVQRSPGHQSAAWARRAAVAVGLAAATGVLLALDSLFLEPRRLQHRRCCIEVAGLPAALDGFTVLHLSDLHYVPKDRWLPERLADLAAATAGAPPDLIAITGDFVEWDDDAPALAKLLAPLRSRHGCFAVLGNHDYGNFYDPHERPPHPQTERLSDLIGQPLIAWKGRPEKPGGNDAGRITAALEGAGIRVLRNAAVPIEHHGARLWVGGVDEPHQRRADPAAVFAAIPAGEPLLLLAHSPEVLEPAWPRPAALTLAGHTHGGQVRLPFLKPLVTHTRPDLPAYQGLIATRHGPMHISAGMGATVPLRFRCPPEISTLVLRSTACAGPGCG